MTKELRGKLWATLDLGVIKELMAFKATGLDENM